MTLGRYNAFQSSCLLHTCFSGDPITQHPPESNKPTTHYYDHALPPRFNSVAGSRYYGRFKHKEKIYFKQNPTPKRTSGMDWLFDQGIVFDVLPDAHLLEKLINSENKTQALACLTYLENEPEQEVMSIWQMLIPLLASAGGFTIAFFFGDTTPETTVVTTPEATVVTPATDILTTPEIGLLVGGVGLILLLISLHFASKKNYHIKNVAAWANSWSTAIKEFEPAESKEQPQPTEQKEQPKNSFLIRYGKRLKELYTVWRDT